jgi:CDP-diglyceride synthetase
LLTVWNCDSGALLAGRLFKHWNEQPPPSMRISPQLPPAWLHRISPAKSVVGLYGGLVGGTLTYMALPWFWRWIYSNDLATIEITSFYSGYSKLSDKSWSETLLSDAIVGLALSLAGLLGDLWESSLKRLYSVKDSGKLLPGHGGVLDRFDSSLVSVLIYQQILRRRDAERG